MYGAIRTANSSNPVRERANETSHGADLRFCKFNPSAVRRGSPTPPKRATEGLKVGNPPSTVQLTAVETSGQQPGIRKASTIAAATRRRYSGMNMRHANMRRISKNTAIATYVYDCNVRQLGSNPIVPSLPELNCHKSFACLRFSWV